MQQIERSVYSYLNEKLATANPRSNKIRQGALVNLEKYTKEKLGKSLDEFIASFENNEDALAKLQLWVNWNSKRISPSTVRHYFILIKPYLYYKGIKFHPDDVKQEIRFPKVLENEKHGITLSEIKKLFEYLNPTKKAFYLCQLSSGMRVGELMRMRVKQLDFSLDRIMVKIPAEHAKSGKSRITFFSREAEKYLKPLLKNLDDNDLIFTKNENWENARNAEIVNMIRWVKKAGLKDISTHTFRAYFITQTSRIDPNMAKKFAGQKVYLGEYDRPTLNKMLEIYLKFEHELLIYENKPEGEEIKKLRTELDNHQKKIGELEYLQMSLSGILHQIAEGKLQTIPKEKHKNIKESDVEDWSNSVIAINNLKNTSKVPEFVKEWAAKYQKEHLDKEKTN